MASTFKSRPSVSYSIPVTGGPRNRIRLGFFLLSFSWVFLHTLQSRELDRENRPGVLMEVFEGDSDSVADLELLENLACFMSAGDSPSLFSRVSDRKVRMSGFLDAPIRDYYPFKLHFRGHLEFFINEEPVYAGDQTGDQTVETEGVRLKRGKNAYAVHWRLPDSGDAWFRIEWACGDFDFEPPKPEALFAPVNDSLESALQIQTGWKLFTNYRCHACHRSPGWFGGLNFQGPALSGIGSRIRREWMEKWILDPSEHRMDSTMPRMLNGPERSGQARSMAAYLSSLKWDLPDGDHQDLSAGSMIESGNLLYEKWLCRSCHHLEGQGSAKDTGSLSLSHLNSKYHPAALIRFLLNPGLFHPATRMPDFKMNEYQARSLAAYLISKADPAAQKDGAALPPRQAGEGRELLSRRGCLQCHEVEGLQSASFENSPTLAELAGSTANAFQGCLDPDTAWEGGLPLFDFKSGEREALEAFIRQGIEIGSRAPDRVVSGMWVEHLRCGACHTGSHGFPSLETLGAKLNPDWTRSLFEGREVEKARHWLDARMPAFPRIARELSKGLAHRHGYSADPTPQENPDPALAEQGRLLVSATHGFSCVSCHSVKDRPAMQVQESEGVNLALSGRRLRRDYFRRWLLAPMRLDPQTKMPTYFEDGRSPLFTVLDGDAERQVQALWHYLLLGREMPLP